MINLGVKFENTGLLYWTDGCLFSKHCVETAVKLARRKTIAELKIINIMTNMDEVGELPQPHLHCAELAEITLHRSAEIYLDQQ